MKNDPEGIAEENSERYHVRHWGNGYKDEDYIRLALLGRRLGRKIIIVVETYSEVVLIIRVAGELGVEPMIGLRASGPWQRPLGLGRRGKGEVRADLWRAFTRGGNAAPA